MVAFRPETPCTQPTKNCIKHQTRPDQRRTSGRVLIKAGNKQAVRESLTYAFLGLRGPKVKSNCSLGCFKRIKKCSWCLERFPARCQPLPASPPDEHYITALDNLSPGFKQPHQSLNFVLGMVQLVWGMSCGPHRGRTATVLTTPKFSRISHLFTRSKD